MAWAIVENNKVVKIVNTPQSITINGVTHPKNVFTSWSEADRISVGIYQYEESNTLDQRYWIEGEPTYSIGATKVTATREGIARDVTRLKETMLEQVKSTAASRLRKTDWMVIRAAEGGTAVPADIAAYRADVRTASNDKEDAINALSTMGDVIAFENQQFTETRKVTSYDDNTREIVYGPETHDITVTISGVTGLWPVDPTEEADPSFVSRTAV